jgi:1-acyl-sn-glycerol-3-phosphate acyltransferase
LRSNITPFPARLLRLCRLALHLARGLATVVFLFPGWSDARRHTAVRRWSRRLLAILAVRLHCHGMPERLPEKCLLVLNHVSWLDIFLVDSVHPATFVAKMEIRGWPLVGALATRVGTLYIERGSRRAVKRTNERIAAALSSGTVVACFPEGTTTFGHSVGRFHGALFQPAIDAHAKVQPVLLRYRDPAGHISEAGAYVGEDSLMQSVWSLVSTRALVAELHFLPALDAAGRDRRTFAQRVHAEVAGALASA